MTPLLQVLPSLLFAAVSAQTALRFSTPVPISLTLNGSGPVTQVLSSDRATSLSVHIASMHLPPGATLTIGTEDGRDKVVYSGDLRDVYSAVFTQPRILLNYSSPTYSMNSSSAPIVTIDTYFVGGAGGGTESICTSTGDASKPAACYASDVAKTKASKAVARLRMGGSGLCTGWLFGADGYLLTNNHCIGTAAVAATTSIELGAACATCNNPSNNVQLACKGTVVASSVELIATSVELDFSLVKLNLLLDMDLSSYGYLQARDSTAVLNEPIWLVGHPGGKPTRMATVVEGNATGSIVSLNVANSCQSNEVGYLLDTQGGSSGSPVLSTKDNSVIALHNCGGCDASTLSNAGIPITSILAHLRANGVALPPNAIMATPTPTPTPTTTPTPTPTTTPTPTPTSTPIRLCTISNRAVFEYYSGVYYGSPSFSANEQFEYDESTGAVRVASNGQCLDAWSSDGGASYHLHTYACDASNANQRWTIANGQVQHRTHGICLTTVAGASAIGVARCDASAVRQWISPTNCRTSSTVRSFVQLVTSRQRVVSEWYTSVLAKAPAGGWTELWEQVAGGGLRSFSNGQCLDAYLVGGSSYTLHTYACDASNGNQKWSVGNGLVKHATHPNLCLDIDPTDPNMAAQTWTCYANAVNQRVDVVAFE
ncbi:hypothetical protein SPRG_11861 [Saprolegnia parasitica CBS 223.65]|uniref:Ricin B lectin domain-containing protein n=1 Tax=Saprolegnia parasitica (strain CBS 223.65) TaxID=695850 RepID=A0A067C1L0_SAPPC|nr:hypothetical protein SPRG_11861 [Saprolegnia parasitica CBS 223.65]KDO23015.1 hypothetical protein SPRG_11861 [Saprolegnia parasitica CBS 223.65]|eukprot:XP_012206303.1 hypothetical protein SPRG_11861 [Saprolegnia parasitica CBS 223.65]